MQFSKHNWKYGDKITPQDMNYIEHGVAANETCIMFVGGAFDSEDNSKYVLNKTLMEIKSAMDKDQIVIIKDTMTQGSTQFKYASKIDQLQNGFRLYTTSSSNGSSYDALTYEDYPHTTMQV